MSRYKRVFRPWFAWNPSKIEDFLEEFASEGWIVERAGFSMMWFKFTKDEPKMVRYCVDYQWKAEPEYKQILADDGWQLINESNGWLLWSKEYSGKRPHLYTDKQSLIDRNRKIIYLVGVCLLAQFPALSTNGFERLFNRYLGGWSIAGRLFMGFYGMMLLLMVYGLIRLLLVNRSLQADH